MTAEATVEGAGGQETSAEEVSGTRLHRYRLSRAGILNVWQYDDQQFSFADGRMLLRGANGAGKSKTLEMLLPFVLDGDKSRMTASARHHTSLLWLMTDGYDGAARVGYLWVEFIRTTPEGDEEAFTCGVGIRASASARTATAWYFTTPRRVGEDLRLEDEAGPLSRPRLSESIGAEGHVFDQARAYKEHVGRALFGLGVDQYDEILRLLYWLRQPQVGEDIEPARLAGQLLQALPQLDDAAVRAAGDTFDELAAFGEQIDRRETAARALVSLSEAYSAYAGAAVAARGSRVVEAQREQARRHHELRRQEGTAADLAAQRGEVDRKATATSKEIDLDRGRIQQLRESPEARSHQRLNDLATRTRDLENAASGAERSAERAADQLTVRVGAHDGETDELLSRIRRLNQTTRGLGDSLRSARVDAAVATPLAVDHPALGESQDADRAVAALEAFTDDVEQARRAVGRRQAAVLVVEKALDALTTARRNSQEEDRRAAEAESRWDDSRVQHEAATAAVHETSGGLWTALRGWLARPEAPVFEPPRELTATVLEGLGPAARAAAQPVLDELRGRERSAALARKQHETQLEALTLRRAEIDAEVDHAPPSPVLPRTPRERGGGLWRLVDFAPTLSEEDRAGLEAALQSSGLLDAWVRPGGALLDAERRDTILPPGTPRSGTPTLADVLLPDLAAESQVTAQVVSDVLRRVAYPPDSAEVTGDEAAAVSADGSWALGPLRGRASKERAQYVGATARAEERQRRLDEVTAAITSAKVLRQEATEVQEDLRRQMVQMEGWLRELPSPQPLLRAWATLDERTSVVERDEAANTAAQSKAHAARQQVTQRRDEADHLAVQNDLDADSDALSALAERLRGLTTELGQHADTLPGLARDLTRWATEARAITAELEHVELLREEGTSSRGRSDRVAAELGELRSAVGADVRGLQERLASLTTAVERAEVVLRGHTDRLTELVKGIGAAEHAVATARERVEEHQAALLICVRDLAALVDVPGLLASGFGRREVPDTDVLVAAGRAEAGDALPQELGVVARAMLTLVDGEPAPDPNSVYRAWTEATSGPAADHEPKVVQFGDLIAVAGRDEGGECPIGQLAARVSAAVERDQQLLTQRERERFEQHILGELGDAIRRRRMEAEELVEAMNRLLGGVTTSQGIRVRLDWRLRDDVPGEAREAVRLLTQPVGALLPEERATLRDSLHRLIDASRAEQPELSYTEHLGLALDYRRWFAFRIRYTRPETEGRWLELHRRSPLSQGEQKVLCYLPLFAAAAAHFSSLAGAAPHAPRLVLLDDAFPKIDVRTHPLLFGLLVQLDLDFVITSERLWGDHETLPSLAIYEALRDPSQRGIAQYEFRWDGRLLRALS